MISYQDFIHSKNFFLLAGPCVIEGEEMALRIAERMVEITDKLHIPYVFKGSYRKANRSRIDSFTGIGDEKALQELVGRLDPKVYTFTYSIGAGRSVSLAKKLKDRGFQHVYFMPGGIGKWVGAGYPLESSIDPAKSLTLEGYQKQVASQHLTFVDISSKHCGGCRALHPILDGAVHAFGYAV